MLARVSLVMVALLVVASSTRPADACINPVRISTTEAVALVSEAERLIAAGEYERAAAKLGGEVPDAIFGLGVRVERDRALQTKLELLAATVQVRMGRTKAWGMGDELEARLEVRGGEDPVLVALVAELRATSTDERDRAAVLAALLDLEKRDLMPDAASHGVLSRLQAAFHDEAGARRSMERCLAMAHRAAQCARFVAAPVVQPVPAVGPSMKLPDEPVARKARRAARKRAR